MKKSTYVILLALLFSCGVIYPKPAAIGVSIHTEPILLMDVYEYYLLGIGAIPGIRLPIQISESFNIEPELSVWHTNTSYESSGDYTRNSRFGIYSLNIYLKMINKQEVFAFYRGLRLGIQYAESHSKTSSDYDDYESVNADRNQVLGLFYGGEYYFNPQFSVGGEYQFNLTLLEKNDESTSTLWTTGANIIFRWYPGN